MIRYRILLRIAENESFSKTAAEFGYTQSAVSQTVRSLEREWGVFLFSRSRHGVRLTEDGRRLLPALRRLCDAYDALLEETNAVTRLEGAVVRVGSFASVSANWLPELIGGFKKIYPSVRFDLMQGDYETVRGWIREGTVDFGFLTPEVAGKLETVPLLTEEMVLVLPKGHPLAEKKEIALSDFSAEPFIFLDSGKTGEPLSYLSGGKTAPNLQYRVFDDYTIVNMVEQGLGVSILPKLALARFPQQILQRSLTPKITRTICLAYRGERTLSAAGRAFLTYTVKHLENR